MTTRSPTLVDRDIGNTVRLIRINQSMSQSELGEKVGVTFQQIQKYERGTNGIRASRLMMIAEALGVPVSSLLPDDKDQVGGDNTTREFIESERGIKLINHLMKLPSAEQSLIYDDIRRRVEVYGR